MANRHTTTDSTLYGVYDEAYPEAYPQAYLQALPDILYVGNSGCGHPNQYMIGLSCGLCFLQTGYQAELPKRLHYSKSLADNGNPQQTAQLISHVQLAEGLIPPRKDQSLHNFRRARKQYSKAAHENFPFSSVLWELMGYQPPLATPLVRAVCGQREAQIAVDLGLSLYNTSSRIAKGIRWALKYLRI